MDLRVKGEGDYARPKDILGKRHSRGVAGEERELSI